MITLLDDFGMFNHNPVIISLKTLFDKYQLPNQVMTSHLLVMKRAAAKAHDMTPGSIWSIYDYFTGRMLVADRQMTTGTLTATGDYDVAYRAGGEVERVVYRDDKGQVVKIETYDDGGYIAHIEQDGKQYIPHINGSRVFEITRGAGNRVTQLVYLPDNKVFEDESSFLRWAYNQVINEKAIDDKVFVISDMVRRLLLLAEFDPQGVYLLPTQYFDQSDNNDLFFDKYDKVIFTSQAELKKADDKYRDRTTAPLLFNNYLTQMPIAHNYQSDKQIAYVHLPAEYEGLAYAHVASLLMQVLEVTPIAKFIVQVPGRAQQTAFEKHIPAPYKERVVMSVNPNPRNIRLNMAKSMLYINLDKQGLVVPELAAALAAQIPVLALPDNQDIETYLTGENGQKVALDKLPLLINEALRNYQFYGELATGLAQVAETFGFDATLARWQAIFDLKERKL